MKVILLITSNLLFKLVLVVVIVLLIGLVAVVEGVGVIITGPMIDIHSNK
jgi:hypothetical protein